jgi:hypothetical protein
MSYRFTSAALSELETAALDYEAKQRGLGSRFLTEVEMALACIVRSPEAWRQMSQRTRRCLVHRFPFGMFYQIRSHEILILSVMDLRRNPEFWRKHLR